MAGFVATIQVPAAQAVWRADEVPHLTADALYRFVPEPDPMVAKTELRRMTSAEHRNGTPGRHLTARELARMDRKCRVAGLGALPDERQYSQWGEYLEICNDDAEARGWLVALIPPRDPHLAERLAWVIAAEEHRKLLQAAIASGQIHARMAGTLVPATPGAANLQRLVLLREGLEQFAARLAIRVVDEQAEVDFMWGFVTEQLAMTSGRRARLLLEGMKKIERASQTVPRSITVDGRQFAVAEDLLERLELLPNVDSALLDLTNPQAERAPTTATATNATAETQKRASQSAEREARQDARLAHCEARGLVFDVDPLRPLPYGIAKAAASLVPAITRQSLSTDVRAALRRRFERERNGKG